MEDRDPELLEVFAKTRRPVVSETFVARVVWQIGVDEKERHWRKAIWAAVLLVICAIATALIARGFALVVSDFSLDLRNGEVTSEPALFKGLGAALLSMAALGFVTLWRLVRSER